MIARFLSRITIPNAKLVPPVCAACAAGYHEQVLLPNECCVCRCHGAVCAASKVAA